MNYYYKKNFYTPKQVEFVYLFFDNGNYITLNKSEIIDFKFEFYDKMVWFDRSITPVAKSGFIKLKISKYKSSRYDSQYVNNIKEYNENRKKYIENLCCDDSGIVNIRFFDNNNWHKSVCGKFVGRIENGYLILSVEEIWNSIPTTSENFSISLNSIEKSIINKINLDFENCEDFDIFKHEIVDLKLNLNEKLDEDSGDYKRQLINGYIKVKLDPEITYRYISLARNVKYPKVKHIKGRLINGNEKTTHNICHLYIDYEYAGFGTGRVESIIVNGDWIYDRTVYEDYSHFVSGYCIKEKNDVIAIYFENTTNE